MSEIVTMPKKIPIDLNPTQSKFFRADDPVLGFFGGLGNGKTFIGCLKGLSRILDPEQPPQLGLIARQTYPELRDSTQRTFLELMHKFGLRPDIHYNFLRQENRIVFSTGHEVLFRSLDDPAKLLSINLGWFYVDQAEEITEETFLTLLGRLRGVEKPQCWLTGNPLGHLWVWRRFVFDKIRGYKMFTAPTSENSQNLPPGYVESLRTNYNEIWINRYLEGSWDAFEGQIYCDFDERIVVVRDFTPPLGWDRIIAIDHGRVNPTAVLWGAIDYDGVVWIYREHYEAGKDVEYHAAVIQGHMNEGKSEIYLIDPSTGPFKKDDEATIGKEYIRHGIPVLPANSDVSGGIDKVSEYLRNEKIKITQSCINTRKEIVNYQWKQPSPAMQDLNYPEKPLKRDDHAMDALRYMIAFVYDATEKPVEKTPMERFLEQEVDWRIGSGQIWAEDEDSSGGWMDS